MGVRFGDSAPRHRDVFYPDGSRCVRLKLTADCEIPASQDPKIEYVGFRSWDSVLGKLLLDIGAFFTQAVPAAFG